MTDRFRALQIIWLALMGGVVVFAVVAYTLTVVDLDMASMPPIVLRVVGPAAVVMMGAGLLVRRKLVEAIPAGVRGDERIRRR